MAASLSPQDTKVYIRGGDHKIEEPYEIPVILPAMGNKDLATNI